MWRARNGNDCSPMEVKMCVALGHIQIIIKDSKYSRQLKKL
jgi:hypothetical protein